jgi:hypothetical protein
VPGVSHLPTIGLGVRLGLMLQDPKDPRSLRELHLDNSYNAVDVRFKGEVTESLGWNASFNADLNSAQMAAKSSLGVMDLLARFRASSEFNIWLGRLVVPADRSNLSGPFYIIPWNFPGFYHPGQPRVGSKHGPSSRDVGVTAWGSAFGDKLKYYAGVYGIDVATPKAYYSGRLSYSFQGTEPGYYGPSTFYGKRRLVTLGVGGQYQRKGSIDTSAAAATGARRDTLLLMADLLVEEPVADVGTFTFEAQGYAFNSGYAFGSRTLPDGAGTAPLFAPRKAFYLLVSYLTPRSLGVGKLQPLVRWQQTQRPAWRIVDAAMAYIIKDSSARVVLTARRIDRGGDSAANSIQLGVQLQSP